MRPAEAGSAELGQNADLGVAVSGAADGGDACSVGSGDDDVSSSGGAQGEALSSGCGEDSGEVFTHAGPAPLVVDSVGGYRSVAGVRPGQRRSSCRRVPVALWGSDGGSIGTWAVLGSPPGSLAQETVDLVVQCAEMLGFGARSDDLLGVGHEVDQLVGRQADVGSAGR